MSDTNRQPLWQVLAPILDESVLQSLLQSLRDMDDPDAERDHHDAERIADYVDTVMDLANWLVPEEAEPRIYEHCDRDDLVAWHRWDECQSLRALLTAEADRAERGND